MNTLIVPSKKFRLNFPKYQKIVEKGLTLIVVKRSKPIFKIEPVDTDFEEKITKALFDYEDKKTENFVKYDEVFN